MRNHQRQTVFMAEAEEHQINRLCEILDDNLEGWKQEKCAEEDSEFFNGSYERITPTQIEIRSGEFFVVDNLTTLICEWQKETGVAEFTYFEWAEWPARSDNPTNVIPGGGATVCYLGEYREMNTQNWALDMCDSLIGENPDDVEFLEEEEAVADAVE